MVRLGRIALVVVVAIAAAAISELSPRAIVDAAFTTFWSARGSEEAARAIPDILKSRVTVDEALERLRQGRRYSNDVSRGVVGSRYTAGGREFFFFVNVPENYSPSHKYQVRVQLHGGVMRPTNLPAGGGSIGALAGVEQIYILPTGWVDAPWWSTAQLENVAAILDAVKRTYNVDENRVVLSGHSDGATGAFYVAMKDTTRYASFLPLNGNLLVLGSPELAVGNLYPTNLRNKPLFVINGGLDPRYPASYLAPYVKHLQDKGVRIDFRPQAQGAHNTDWWPDVKEPFETFVRDNPRGPLPDRLTWETDAAGSRAHWLVIDRLGRSEFGELALDDVNIMAATGGDTDPLEVGPTLFDQSGASGRVDLTRDGNTVTAATRGVAEFTLLISPDAFDLSRPIKVVANGRTAFDRRVEPDLRTLLTWAARDNDRTMLFVAELHIKP